jgi:hypothetical protein
VRKPTIEIFIGTFYRAERIITAIARLVADRARPRLAQRFYSLARHG